MKISTEKHVFLQDKNLNVGIDTKKHVELRLKDSQKNSTEMLKKITTDNSDVRVTLRGKPESVVYTKPEIKHAQVTQSLAMEKNIAEKKVIENTPLDGASVGEIAKEVGISLVPIYGTIHEFQKGNIGWGIFGAITDALMLIPVVGTGAKAVGAAIRGGTTAVRAARVGLTAAEVTSKITTTTVAKQFTVGASEGLAKSGKDLGKAILRTVDPGIELVYGGGGFIGKQTAKLSGNITSTTAKSADVLENIFKWKNFTSSVPVSDTINVLQNDFHKIKSTSKLSEQFMLDFHRATYKIDGKVIPRGDYIKFEKAIPDIQNRQLISAYANQTVLADPSVGFISSSPNLFMKHGASTSEVSYEIRNISDGKIKLIAKYESHLKPITDLADGEKTYSSYGIKAEMVLSKNILPKPKYSSYLC